MPMPPPLQTDQLLRRAADGDAAARDAVWDQYRPRLRRMVAMRMDRRIAARVDASDVVQEALAIAHQRLPQYVADPQVPFYPWLRRIAWDRLIMAYRTHISAERRSVLRERPPVLGLSGDSTAMLSQVIAASSCAPQEQAIRAELHRRVIDSLGELKPQDREILIMRHLEQLPVPEVAATLGISQTAVTSRHLRALERLRALLRDEYGDK
jgi:RNA polymerase sigma-70 factor (ECF subfamily)